MIPTMAAILLILLLCRRKLERTEKNHDTDPTDHYNRLVYPRNDADPFSAVLIFRENRKTPEVIQYREISAGCGFGMLVVYCLRNVSIVSGSHGLPELIAILVTCGLHLWKRQMLLSIAGGTVCYMLLLHFVFA